MSTNPLARRSMWIVAVALIVLSGAIFWSFDHKARAAAAKPATTAAAPVKVTTVAAKQQDVPIYRAGIGTATPLASVTVKARIDGQLDAILFKEGQDVKAGQVLARIDPRTLQAQLAQAEAQKAKDQAQLGNARVDLKRYTQLIAQESATQQQVDTQTALVAQLAAAVQSDDAQVNFAKVQLSFTTIVAPISGRVGARLVDPGNIVHATDANGLVVINQIDPIAVVFTLPEEAFQEINQALHASPRPLTVDAYPRTGDELLGHGALVLLNNQIDTSTGTVQLKARFPNAQHMLWPGQYVNARLLLGTRRHALTVPAQAVQRSQDGTYLYVVSPDGKTVQNQAIRVGQTQDNVAVIDEGLEAGQRVVVDGQYKLKPGARIVEAAPARPPTAATADAGPSP